MHRGAPSPHRNSRGAFVRTCWLAAVFALSAAGASAQETPPPTPEPSPPPAEEPATPFLADNAAAVGPEVTSRDVVFEVDWYMDWKVNRNFAFSFVAAFANPGKLVEQLYDRTKNFAYGMVYVAYSY
jgi:hypothetical protein